VPASKLLAMNRRTMSSLTLSFTNFMSGPYLLIERGFSQGNECGVAVPKRKTASPQLGQSCSRGLPCRRNQAGLRRMHIRRHAMQMTVLNEPHSAQSSRRILTVVPVPGEGRQVFATGSQYGPTKIMSCHGDTVSARARFPYRRLRARSYCRSA
jgi:hypothetical protein